MLSPVVIRYRLNADGFVDDRLAAKHWMVKFPRGRSAEDRMVIKNEAAYMEVAQQFGLRVKELPLYLEDTLFVPRFNREVVSGKLNRLGLETLASLADILDFGGYSTQERLLASLVKAVSDPITEVREYILRDLLPGAPGKG